MNEGIVKLDPLLNQLVRFKLLESPETFEATILAFDETGYWVRGGSLCDYLKNTTTPHSVDTDVQFVEFRQIRSIQKVAT